MSNKNQFPFLFNWQATSPVITFLPTPYQTGSHPSGVTTGTMSGTNTIYTNIIDISKMDNVGLEVVWTGTPVGTFQVMMSDSGINFFAVTFTPPLAQPAGAPGGYGVSLNQYPWKYMMLQYTNSAGSGIITVYSQYKDLN